MSLEYGIDRYAEELAAYFKDNIGPAGANGISNKLIAKEVRQKLVAGNTTYTGLTHTIAAGELEADDLILFNLWYEPTGLASVSVGVKWQTPLGDQIQVMSSSQNSAQHYVFAITQDAYDTSLAITTSYQTLVVGNKSTSTVRILSGGVAQYNWISYGGSVVMTFTTGAGAPGLIARAYYYHLKK